jgi:hypothetical protein
VSVMAIFLPVLPLFTDPITQKRKTLIKLRVLICALHGFLHPAVVVWLRLVVQASN